MRQFDSLNFLEATFTWYESRDGTWVKIIEKDKTSFVGELGKLFADSIMQQFSNLNLFYKGP